MHTAGRRFTMMLALAFLAAPAGALGRAGDPVARYGGEEFVALLPGMAAEDAWVLAERLRAGVLALGLPHDASAVSPW